MAASPGRERFAPFRRPVHLISLGLALAVLVAAGLGRTLVGQIPFWGDPFPLGRTLAFTLDHLSLMCSLLLIGSLLSVGLSEHPGTQANEADVVTLFVAATGVAVLVSANMTTLCLAWVFLDLALLWIDTHRASRSATISAVRNLVLRTASTIALVAATVLLLAQQGDAPIPLLEARGLPGQLLMAAALLRIGLYPLPGGFQRGWLTYLVSVATGGYVWLRLAGLSTLGLPGGGWLVPVAGTVLLVTGLLAALSDDEEPTLAYLVSHWMALLVLAPVLGLRGGLSVGLAAMVNIALAIVPLAALEGGGERSIWWRVPTLVQVVSAGGGPLTIGLLTRWAFLRLAWEEGYSGLFAVAVAAFALASVPAWRQVALLLAWPSESVAEPAPDADPDLAPAAGPAPEGSAPPADGAASAAPARPAVASLVGAWYPALILILGGTVPALLRHPGARLIGQVTLPLAEGYGAIAWAGAPAYAAAAALLVLAIGYLLAHHTGGGRPSAARLTAHTFLEMDWLYSSAERSLAWVEGTIARGTAVIEEGSMALGWILLWLLAGLLLLTGR
ncbi:MAG: hypothetical protein GX649_06290 [Chloroflexi bacterium]|nr:hypothetical protein [Chloroflexota bacterium]